MAALEEEPRSEMEAAPEMVGWHECPYCEMSFAGYRSLKTHIGHHFRKGEVRRKGNTSGNSDPSPKRKKKKLASLTHRLSCDICGTVCSNRHSLLRHHMIHTGQRPYKCDTCGKGFIANWNLKMHKCLGYSAEAAFTCTECGERFFDEATFNNHSCKEHHQYQKPETGIPSPSASTSYDVPKNEATTEQAKWECRFCDRTFTTPKGLGGHMSIHRPQSDKPESTTLSSNNNNNSEKVETNKGLYVFDCKICGRQFNCARGHARHMSVHRNQENTMSSVSYQLLKEESNMEKLTWDCPICKRVFTSSNGLGSHMNVHRPHVGTPESIIQSPSPVNELEDSEHTNWKCQFCEKVFLSRKGLCGHMRAHRFRTGSQERTTPSPSLANESTSPLLANRSTPSPLLANHATPSPLHASYATPLSDYHTSSSPLLTNRTTPSPSLSNHAPNDQKPKKTVWECQFCDKIFPSSNALGGHKRAHRVTSDSHVNVLAPLVTHDAIRHNSEDQPSSTEWECQFCAQLFFESKALTEHLYQIHNYQNSIVPDSQVPQKCLICHRVFTNAMALGGHMSVHKAKPAIKQKSPKPQIRPLAISPHKAGKPEVACTVCAKVYHYKASLRRHMSSHVDERGPFRCPHCEESQELMSDLLIHMEEHQINKCELCYVTFEHPSLLEQHMKIHHSKLLGTPDKQFPIPETSHHDSAEHSHGFDGMETQITSSTNTEARPTSSSISVPTTSAQASAFSTSVDNRLDLNLHAVLTSQLIFSSTATTIEAVNANRTSDTDVTDSPQLNPEFANDAIKEAFQMLEHEQKESPQDKQNCCQCKTCYQYYPKGLSFIRHKAWHTRRGDDVLQDPSLDDKAQSVQSVESTEQTDTINEGENVSMGGQLKSVLYPCPVCHQKYTMAQNMQRHLKHAHGTRGIELLRSNSNPLTINRPPQMKLESEGQQEGTTTEKALSDLMYEDDPDAVPRWKRYKRGLFKCPICKRDFTWYHNMRTHMKKLHYSSFIPGNRLPAKSGQARQFKFPPPTHRVVDGRRRIICGVCNREFVNNSGFGMHMRVHRLKATKNIPTNSPGNAVLEAPEGTAQRAEIQGKTTSYQSNVETKTGMLKKYSDTPGPLRYFCPTCSQGFFYFCRLKRHISQQHNSVGISSKPRPSPPTRPMVTFGSKFLYCRFCPRHFLNTGTLKNHEKWNHLRSIGGKAHLVPILPKPPQSEVCIDPPQKSVKLEPAVTSATTDASSHTPPENSAASPSRSICRICSRTFSNHGNLMRHIKLHPRHKLLGNSSTLGKEYTQKPVDHKISTIYRDGLPACGLCEKVFRHKSMLERHKRCHTGEKPFECPVCAACFTVSWSRLVHVRKSHPTYPVANLKYIRRHVGNDLHPPALPQLNTNQKESANLIPPAGGKTQYCIKNLNGNQVFCCESCGKTFHNCHGLNGHKRHCGFFKRDRLNNLNNNTNAVPSTPTIIETLTNPIDDIDPNSYSCDNTARPWHSRNYKDSNGVGTSSEYNIYGASNQYIYSDSNQFAAVKIKEEPQDDYPQYGPATNNPPNVGDSGHNYAQSEKTAGQLSGEKVLDDAIGSIQALSKAIDKFTESRVLSESDSEADDPVHMPSDEEEPPLSLASNNHSGVYSPSHGPRCDPHHDPHDSPSSNYQGKDPSLCVDQSHPATTTSYDSDTVEVISTKVNAPSTQAKLLTYDLDNIDSSTSIAANELAQENQNQSVVFNLLTRKNLNNPNQNKALATIKRSVLNDRLRGESGFILGSVHTPTANTCSEGEVLEYLIGHPRGFGPFCCPICHRRFPTPSLFANHLMFHVDKCPDASYLANVFRPANDLLCSDDCNCHLFGLNFTECPKCVQGYTDLDDLKQHVVQHVRMFLERQAAELHLY